MCGMGKSQRRPTGEDVLESKLNVAGIQGGCLDERKVIIACTGQRHSTRRSSGRTSKLLRIFRGHRPQMPQIALVPDQHDDNVGVSVVPEFLQPPVDVIVGLVLADIVHKESPDSTAIVGRRNRPVPLLACRVPDLSLDRLGIYLDRPGRELDADGRLGV